LSPLPAWDLGRRTPRPIPRAGPAHELEEENEIKVRAKEICKHMRVSIDRTLVGKILDIQKA